MSYLFDCYAGIYDRFMKIWHLDDTSIIENELINHEYSILDIGGGSGKLGDKLIKQGHQVTILDASLPMLKQAAAKNHQLKLIHSNLVSNLQIAKVDVIICRDCFHHLVNQEESLQIMGRYLKDDGFILIHEFNPKALRIKLLFLFELCCFEKIKPVSYLRMVEMAKVSHYCSELIYQGKWDYVCKIQKNN